LEFQAIAPQLEFLAWRDTQLAAASLQVEEAFPDLLEQLALQVEQATIIDLVRSTLSLKKSAGDVIKTWGVTQMEDALRRAEAELDRTIQHMPDDLNLDADAWDHFTKALPALAGVGLVGMSVAAIPTVVSFATVSTSIFAFWGTATISWPLFAVGAVGIGLASLTGSQSLKLAQTKARERLRNRLDCEAARQVFGIGQKPDARCILNDIQAAIIQAGQNRIMTPK
jgi:hypothetical protein